MTELFKKFIRYMLDAHNAYNGTGMMMALYFVAMLIIICYCKDKKLRKSILIPSGIMVFVMYVMVPLYNTVKRYLEFYDGRMFWMMITPVIIAIGFTIFVDNIEDNKIKIAALVILVAVFVYCGKFQISDAMYKKAENLYRLPQSSVDITEYVTSEMDEPLLVVPYTIAYPFRQLSTDVYLLYGEDASAGRIWSVSDGRFRDICTEMEKTIPDLNYIIPICKEYNADYILFDTVYTEFCENGNINIYGYPIDKNYVGDRTPLVTYDDIIGGEIIDDEKGIYWDLSAYDLSYEGTFGQYILYKIGD